MIEQSGVLKAACGANCACERCVPAVAKSLLSSHGANCVCCSPQSQISLNSLSLAELVDSLVGKGRV